MRLLLISLLSVFVTMTLFNSSVHACSCPSTQTVSESVDKAIIAFTGQVTAKNPTNLNSNSQNPVYLYTFVVDQTWKGSSFPMVPIQSPEKLEDGGYPFVVGEHYFVIAHTLANGTVTDICWQTCPTTEMKNKLSTTALNKHSYASDAAMLSMLALAGLLLAKYLRHKFRSA
jgi:hypothetical protein